MLPREEKSSEARTLTTAQGSGSLCTAWPGLDTQHVSSSEHPAKAMGSLHQLGFQGLLQKTLLCSLHYFNPNPRNIKKPTNAYSSSSSDSWCFFILVFRRSLWPGFFRTHGHRRPELPVCQKGLAPSPDLGQTGPGPHSNVLKCTLDFSGRRRACSFLCLALAAAPG